MSTSFILIFLFLLFPLSMGILSCESEKSTNLPSNKFVLRHGFKDMSKRQVGSVWRSPKDEHFGLTFYIGIGRYSESVGLFLICEGPSGKQNWSVRADVVIVIFKPNGESYKMSEPFSFERAEGRGWDSFINWEEMMKEYVVDDELVVEIRIKEMKTTGVYSDNLMEFDNKKFSDMELIVKDKKFYVSKLYLAAHSSYFESMFLGDLEESKKDKITLSDVNPEDFQKYLEALYGESAIDEFTVEGILLLADMYNTKLLVMKCEEFLLKESTKSLKKILEMAVEYNLTSLKKECLAHIKSADDIRSVLPSDIENMDPSLMAILLKKSLRASVKLPTREEFLSGIFGFLRDFLF